MLRSALGGLYGLAMVHNSPEMPALIHVNATSGLETLAGPALTPLAATGDLVALDTSRNVLWYLGDTSMYGTTLTGVSLSNGSVICEQAAPFREIGFVGLGQSLNFLPQHDSLVISGIITSPSNVSAHVVYTGSADPSRCGSKLTLLASFDADSDYVPMLHSSALDANRERLFLGLATSANSFAVGIVDLKSGTLQRVDAEDATDAHQLIGMKFDPASGTLTGLASSADYTALFLVQLAPETGVWRVRTIDTAFPVVLGNAGSVSAFDAATGSLYALLAANTSTSEVRLATVDVASATLTAAPVLQQVGLGLLLNLVFADETR